MDIVHTDDPPLNFNQVMHR